MHFNPYFIMSLSIDININAFQFYLLYNKNSYILIFGKNNQEGGGVEMLLVLVNIKQQWYFYQNWKQFDVSFNATLDFECIT